VAERDIDAEIAELSQMLTGIERVLEPDKLREQVAELEEQAASPDLWDDVDRAQKVTSRLSYAQAELRKVPYMLVVGDDEAASETVSVRRRSGRERRGVALDDFVTALTEEVAVRRLEPSV
jgi:peptide chain release factor 2